MEPKELGNNPDARSQATRPIVEKKGTQADWEEPAMKGYLSFT